MDGGTWWATVHGVAESDMTEWPHFLFFLEWWLLKSSCLVQPHESLWVNFSPSYEISLKVMMSQQRLLIGWASWEGKNRRFPFFFSWCGLFLNFFWRFFFFLLWTISLITYWLCSGITYVLYFGFLTYAILAAWWGIEPTPSALEGKVLTSGRPGKSPILKVFIEFVILLLLFYVLFSLWPQSMCDFSSLTRDGTHTSCIQKWSLNHWTAREVFSFYFFKWQAPSDSLLLFSRAVMSNSLQSHELHHARLPCLSPTPRACSDSTSIESVMPSNHLILCCPLLLLLSIFLSIRIFSSESALRIRWPEYWSFIYPSNEYSGLISFRMDWFDLLAVQGTLKSLLQHHSLKISVIPSED